MNELHLLKRVDDKRIPHATRECRAVLVVYNEARRLPALLRYYRNLGVERFFVVDNLSNDGTTDYLLRQNDCHIFATVNSYLEAGFGCQWQQAILDNYGEDNWWLIIDADEQFVYPDCETVNLPQFTHYLDTVGANAASAFLLDMYSQQPVAEAHYQTGQPFLDVARYFDRAYTFWPRPSHRRAWRASGHRLSELKRGHAPLLFPAMDVLGGPRLRRFTPHLYNPSPWTVLKIKALRHMGRLITALRLRLPPSLLMPAVLFKVPLIKAGQGIRLIDSHSVQGASYAPVTGAILHFKFFSDFHARVVDAVERGQHFDGGGEYARYLNALGQDPALGFYFAGSVAYENSMQLVTLGLIKDDPGYVRYRQKQPYDAALAAIATLLDDEDRARPTQGPRNEKSDR